MCPVASFIHLSYGCIKSKINRASEEGVFRGIEISRQMKETHSFFVDDILIFGLMIRESWKVMYEILNLFCDATGMLASVEKSCIYHVEGDEEMYRGLGTLFNFKLLPLNVGLTYLGFRMKAGNYIAND